MNDSSEIPAEKKIVLVIEDEASIAETINYALRSDGFETHWRATGGEGLVCAQEIQPHLIILDIGLPDTNGFDVFKRLQAVFDMPPAVIFLTARSEEVDRIVGLELGADDYMAKPFSPRELCARVRAVLRRAQPRNSPQQSTKETLDQCRTFFTKTGFIECDR